MICVKRFLCATVALIIALQLNIISSALSTKAAAAVVLDIATGEVLYEKNPNERMSIASTTKIMTALVVLENASLKKVHTVTADEAQIEGSALGIGAGNVISVENLLYGLLLVSGNDAAYALAGATSGSVDSFVALMNKKAEELRLENTHFSNPAGLSDDNHYSSAYDMALLTSYALQNKTFSKICALSDYEIALISPNKKIYLHNHNRLLSDYKGCIGVKTGYTERAGRCLVSAAKRNGQTLIAVTLNDSDDWKDHKKLLDYGFSLSEKYICDVSQIRIPVVGAIKSSLEVYGSGEVYIPKTCVKRVKLIIISNHFLYAPIKKGEAVAKAKLFCNSRQILEVNLYSKESLKVYRGSKSLFGKVIG